MNRDSLIAWALQPTGTEWGSSRWGELRRCARAHHLRYHLKVIPAPRPAVDDDEWGTDERSYFDVGGACHAVMAYVHEGTRLAIPFLPWTDVLEAAADAKAFDQGAIYEAERLMGAYWARYGLDNAGWDPSFTIEAVEEFHEIQVGGRPYTTRIDARLRHQDSGRVFIVDHKTRSQNPPGCSPKAPDEFKRARYERGLKTRPQFCGSTVAAQRTLQLEEPPVFIVNTIVKTKLPAFHRFTFEIPTGILEFWEGAQRTTAQCYIGPDDDPEFDAVSNWIAPADMSQCAPEIGSRCTYFEYCHGTEESRARHFTTEESLKKEAA